VCSGSAGRVARLEFRIRALHVKKKVWDKTKSGVWDKKRCGTGLIFFKPDNIPAAIREHVRVDVHACVLPKMPRVYTSKYSDFLESEPVSRRGKLPPHEMTDYVDIKCPHCHQVCTELPASLLKTQKANSCLKHLRVCPEFKGSVTPTSDKKGKMTNEPNQGGQRVTIYKVMYLPDNRAVYTGRTKDPMRRMRQHASQSSSCRLLRNAIRRYGRSKFAIVPIVRCMPSDADANESYYIMTNKTMHPDGYNLRHGAMAGVEPDEGTAMTATGIDVFRDVRDEMLAEADAIADVAHMCIDLEDCSITDDVCRDLLREVHPDRAGERSYSANEVATMLNTIRESVRGPL